MSDHIMPLKIYLAVFGALMVMTAVTIWVAYMDLGVLNTVVAVGIACIKALLVVLYFMHARYGTRLVWMILITAVVWLAILIGMTMGDYGSRDWLSATSAGQRQAAQASQE